MNHRDTPERLTALLADWRVAPRPDPAFRTQVWARLHRNARTTWAAYVRTHLAGWALAGTLAVVAAGWTGHQAAQARLEAQREKMVVSYLGNLDPRVMAKLPGAAR